jgi:pyridoxamine 5'-phosphate oxidase
MKKSFADYRFEYILKKFDEKECDPDPFHQFNRWFEEASVVNPHYSNAMILSTTDSQGKPSSRTVFLKGIDKESFVFYTSYLSRKGKNLSSNPFASLIFFWPELERQIRIEGKVRKVSSSVSDKYFSSRPRESQIGAWASSQSEIISDRIELEKRFGEIRIQYEGKVIPRPDYWGGYGLKPDYFEFWQGREGRMHDRIIYRKDKKSWITGRLCP